MKKSLPKQSGMISENLVVFRPLYEVSAKRVGGQFYAIVQLENHNVHHMLTSGFTRKTRARQRKFSSWSPVVIKSLNTYSVDKDPTRLWKQTLLIDNYSRKQFPLSRTERKKAAVALVRYSKDRFVYLTIKQAITLVQLFETMLKGVNYFISEGVQRRRTSEKYFIERLFKQPMWLYSVVRAVFNMMDSIHEDGLSLRDQIEEIQDRLDRLYRETP